MAGAGMVRDTGGGAWEHGGRWAERGCQYRRSTHASRRRRGISDLRWLFYLEPLNLKPLYMKKILLPLLTLILALTPALSRAEEAKAKPEKEETPLEKSMDALNKSWRKLRKQAADPAQNASSLVLLAAIQAATKESLSYSPDLARDVPADKRDQFIAGYKKKIKETIVGFDQVEIALKAGDNKSVVEMLTNISALQKEGHKEYKRPE